MPKPSRRREMFLDWYWAGPRFCMSGIRAELSKAETIEVQVFGDRRGTVRPGQSDFSTFRQVFRDRDYRVPRAAAERVERAAARIRDSGMVPVVIDAGANIGAATMWFRWRFPETAIVAIEPDPGNAAIARRNIAGLRDVVLMEAAVGGEPGFASVIASDQAWAVKTERAASGCPIVTIDQAVGSMPSGKAFAVKIDIEGFESDLFSNTLGWMDDVAIVFLEPHDWLFAGKGTSRSFQKAFGERDFDVFVQGENLVYVRRD